MTSLRTMMGTRALGLAAAGAVLLLSGCTGVQRTPPLQVWWDMKWQDRFHTESAIETPELKQIFPDGRQMRRPPEGTIARGFMREENTFNTGMDGKLYVGKMPIQITPEVLADGEARFNIYCTPCHDRTGLGKGMVPKRATNWQPANLMEDRVVQLADGDIFNVITYGRRTMPPYFEQIPVEERWHIIAYLRVLQRAAHGTINDVPEAERASLAYKGAN
jgi:mono/diheme cytochrome c family protein